MQLICYAMYIYFVYICQCKCFSKCIDFSIPLSNVANKNEDVREFKNVKINLAILNLRMKINATIQFYTYITKY